MRPTHIMESKMKKAVFVLGMAVVLTGIGLNIQYAIQGYGITMNSLHSVILALDGTGTGTGTGGHVLYCERFSSVYEIDTPCGLFAKYEEKSCKGNADSIECGEIGYWYYAYDCGSNERLVVEYSWYNSRCVM